MNLAAKIEQSLGGLKFAVSLLVIFALFMTVGTFCESYFGTEFANRFLYKTPLFLILQLSIFFCVAFAALLRLPPKKRLYGFYTIHSGLILIGAGSFVTFYAGIDGNIHLPPQTPSRHIVLDDDLFKISFIDQGKEVSYKLPYSAFKRDIDKRYQDIKILKYLPFAEKEFRWLEAKETHPPDAALHSGRFSIANDNVKQSFTLSLHPEALDFKK